MSIYLELVLFALGLAIGSFLNVFILRYSPEDKFFDWKRTKGRSHCPHCHKTLSWYELIPLASYMIQRGRCRVCQARLTVQYPLVELASALIFVFVPKIIQNFFFFTGTKYTLLLSGSSAIWIIVFLLLLSAFIIDLRHYIIPNTANLTIFILGILWVVLGSELGVFSSVFGSSFLKQYGVALPSFSSIWLNHLLGAVAGSLFFFLIVVLSRGKAMGMGDVKLIGALGLLFGWPDIGVVILLSFIIGAIISVFLVIKKDKKLSDKVPFGPFIVIASAVVFFVGTGLMKLYFGIIGL